MSSSELNLSENLVSPVLNADIWCFFSIAEVTLQNIEGKHNKLIALKCDLNLAK